MWTHTCIWSILLNPYCGPYILSKNPLSLVLRAIRSNTFYIKSLLPWRRAINCLCLAAHLPKIDARSRFCAHRIHSIHQSISHTHTHQRRSCPRQWVDRWCIDDGHRGMAFSDDVVCVCLCKLYYTRVWVCLCLCVYNWLWRRPKLGTSCTRCNQKGAEIAPGMEWEEIEINRTIGCAYSMHYLQTYIYY